MAFTTESRQMYATSSHAENKRIVRDFYDLTFNERQPSRAADKFLGTTYRQHNPVMSDGVQAFVAGITGRLTAMPDLKVDFKRIVAEADLVVLHSHFTPAPESRGMAVVDIFRLDGGKIVEHWDVAQEVPETSANKHTMF